MFMSKPFRLGVAVITAVNLLYLPLCGCSRSGYAPGANEDSAATDSRDDWTRQVVDAAKKRTTEAWEYTTDAAGTTFVVIREQAGKVKDTTTDAVDTVWLWSKDKSADGWAWLEEHGDRAAEWATSEAGDAWLVTKDQAGEFSLWVKVEVNEGVAWAKTTLPAAWKVTKDAAGTTWIWIDDHKVEIAVAAAVVTIVVVGLLTAPEAVAVVGAAAGKGAVAVGGGAAARFLADLYQKHRKDLGGLSMEQFSTIGSSIITHEGEGILSFRKSIAGN